MGAREKTLIASCLVVLSVPARAEEPLAVTDAEFSALFLKSSSQVAALQAGIEISQAEQTAAALLANPSLSLEREVVFGDEASPYDQFARLSLPLDISGKRGKRGDAANKAVLATRAEADHHRFVLLLDALEIYYDAAQARMRVEVLLETRTQLVKLVESVRTRQTNGDASGYDVKRVELELGTHDDYLQEAQTELLVLQRKLASMVGQPGKSIAATDTLSLPKSPLIDAAHASQTKHLMRGDIRGARLRVEEAAEQAKAAARSWIPPLTVSAGIKQADLGTETATGYAVGLSVELPIFDRGQAQAQHASASKRFWLNQVRAFEEAIQSATETADYRLSRKVKQTEAFETSQLAAAVELMHLANAAFREGEKSMFDLLDAHRVARDVRLRLVELRRQAKNAEMAVWRARGYR